MNEKITYLDPNDVETDPRLQVRSVAVYGEDSRIDEGERLKALQSSLHSVVSAGEHSEPIEVFRHDEQWLVFDGHNRLEVYQKVAKKTPVKIPAIIRSYNFKEALSLAYMVNTRHGVSVSRSDATKAAFRSCVFSNDGITVKELIKQGLSERVAQKVRQAARKLIEEAEITSSDDENEITGKVTRWCKRMAKEGFARAGLDSISTDHLGFPSYRFVLDRKPIEDRSEAARIEQMARSIEKLVEQDADVFLAALKRVSRKTRMDLPITVKRQQKSKLQLDEEFEF
ncbi:hypothetical protein OCL06_07400 [Alteromonas sp. ASW11-19]|uniref:ParB/Sulfiredoxin domain-containing protein n=1 Tax=Alteromonas salexigens TaxID=2982530 RepID=A0ABT2VMD8_9ALTE|nr:hypothetical protein [Alteromonas salexigens]MCU7554419.1 hypothetical protein [Alteromonas salexigens]